MSTSYTDRAGERVRPEDFPENKVLDYRNLYRVTYHLFASTFRDVVEERLIIARTFEEAYQTATIIRNDLRPTAVHKECLVRSIELVNTDVVVGYKDRE